MKIAGKLLLLVLGLWSVEAYALLWRLGAVTPDSLRIFATTGDTQKTISVDVTGVGSFSLLESVWTDTSDGSPENTYYAVIEVTGLQPWTTYTYIIYENSVEKGGGSFRTLPNDMTTPFEIALTGCNSANTDGLKDEIVNRSYAHGGSLVAMIHVDDIAYLDTLTVTNVEGLTSTGVPRLTKLSYDYAASWLNVFKDTSDYQDWINHNIPTFWMWGDHEINDNFMTSVSALNKQSTGTRAPGEHFTYDNRLWLAANAAYSKVALAAPDSFDLSYPASGIDGKTYAYGIDLGPVRFFIHDRNTAGECHDCTPDVQCVGKICGEITGHQPYAENFGKTQLDHMKAWLDDASHPFKILFSGITIGGHSIVENQPWLSWWPSEYYDFESWLDNTPTLNGTSGSFLYVAGDRHNFGVHKRSKSPPHNGGADFMEYYVGTINGTSNHSNVPTGEILNGCEVIYSESGGSGNRDHWLTILGISNTELKLTTLDKHHEEIFTGTLQQGAGNHFINVTPGLDVVDVTTPASATLVARTGIRGNKLDLSGNTAYLARGWKGINIVDTSNPAAPLLVNEMNNLFVDDIAVYANEMYLAGGWGGFHVFDRTNALNPAFLSSMHTVANRYASNIYVNNQNMAYIAAGGTPGLQVFDISNPANIQLAGWDEQDEVIGVASAGNYVFVASGSSGLKIIANAQFSTTTDTAANTVQFDIPGHLLQGVYDLTVINPDGTAFKSKNVLTINADSDGDGLSDTDEINIHFTDPANPDTDNDGLSDGDEVNIHATNPTNKDTDSDGAQDGLEITDGTNPSDSTSYPVIPDGDINGDGKVNLNDLLLCTRIALNLLAPTNYQKLHGDVAPLVSGIVAPDGIVNAADIVLIARKSLGLASF